MPSGRLAGMTPVRGRASKERDISGTCPGHLHGRARDGTPPLRLRGRLRGEHPDRAGAGADRPGLYAYPVALLGIVMAFGHVGLEFAQIHLAGQGRDLRHMWANATVFSVVAGIVCWAGVAGRYAVDPRVAGGLPLSWIAIPMGLVPLLLMSLYWASLLQLDGRLMGATWASWFGVALQAVAIAVMFFLHDLTPFRVLLLQWLTNGSAWLSCCSPATGRGW